MEGESGLQGRHAEQGRVFVVEFKLKESAGGHLGSAVGGSGGRRQTDLRPKGELLSTARTPHPRLLSAEGTSCTRRKLAGRLVTSQAASPAGACLRPSGATCRGTAKTQTSGERAIQSPSPNSRAPWGNPPPKGQQGGDLPRRQSATPALSLPQSRCCQLANAGGGRGQRLPPPSLPHRLPATLARASLGWSREAPPNPRPARSLVS